MKITRTITTTKIDCASVILDNGTVQTLPLASITVPGKLDIKKAERKVRKEYAYLEGTIVVTGLEREEKKYGMDVAEFLKHAEVMDDTEPEETETITD